MKNKYLYKNIIRKQRMLNEKHEDLLKLKEKLQLGALYANLISFLNDISEK